MNIPPRLSSATAKAVTFIKRRIYGILNMLLVVMEDRVTVKADLSAIYGI